MSKKSPKLCQIIAVTKGTNSENESNITKLHHTNKKSALFDGQTRTFEPLDDADQLPPENQKVQQRTSDQIEQFVETFSELFDVELTRDVGNTIAKADLVVDEKVILENVPPTFLLALEKEFNKVETFFKELPELDPAEEWDYDDTVALYRAESRKTRSMKKFKKRVQLAPGTKEFAEQGVLVDEEKVAGFWNTTKFSGAIKTEDKRTILRRISAFRKAVKAAREEANSTEIKRYRDVGEKIFGFLLNK